MSETLRISEIFFSLQGESTTAGLPTVFVRLTGCPLRCQYCDTAYAFSGGKNFSLADIVSQVESYSPRYVCVTGGEPMAQANCLPLMTALCDKGYKVSLETSGAMDLELVDPRVIKVMDLKTPASDEEEKNHYANVEYLQFTDQVKFVLCDREDYDWAKEKIVEYKLSEKVSDILMSASHEQLSARTLADWIVEDNLPVRFQVQLHKYLWGDGPGH